MGAGPGQPVAIKDSVWSYRDEDRKDKVHQEFSLWRHMKDNKEGFHENISNNRKTKKNVDLLLNMSGNLMKKTQTQVVNAFLTLTAKTYLSDQSKVRTLWFPGFSFWPFL